MDQPENTNHNRMEHVSLSDKNIGSKELVKSRAHSNDTLINTNQSIVLIDRQGHGHWEISCGISKG